MAPVRRRIPTAGGGRKETYAKASITAQGVGTEVGNLKTSPTGTTRGAVGGVKFDEKGNPTLEVGYLIQGESGSSIKPTFSQGRRVDASEPELQPDGSFLVRYTVTDTTTVGIGGEAKRTKAGMGVGGSISSFDASANSGTRRFTDKKEAEKFQKNAATMLNFTQGTQVPRSAADVKDIAVGESRGSSQTEGTATSLSASYSGFSIGRNTTESTTHGLTVERISDKVVNVTTNVTTEEAKEWAASGLFLTNAKGKSSSHGFSVVLQFDLSTTPGQKGFDFYMATGIPAMGGWKNIGETTIDTQASYDRYSIPLLGTAEWREPEWESDTIGEQGRGHEIGGGQEHQQESDVARPQDGRSEALLERAAHLPRDRREGVVHRGHQGQERVGRLQPGRVRQSILRRARHPRCPAIGRVDHQCGDLEARRRGHRRPP